MTAVRHTDGIPGDAVPAVSVVIPTYRRESRLAFALEALANQTLPSDCFEVVVVRAEQTPNGARAPEDLEVRFLLSQVPGAAAQRNLGWREARAELIAFLDDDCRPTPDWLERLTAAVDRTEEAFVQGWTGPDPDERHLLHGLARTMVVEEPSPWYPTCNIAYPRALLERLGGFDESFPGAYGEDTDLAMRALEAGADAQFANDARVWHAVHSRTLRGAIGDARRRAVVPTIIARHPRVRQDLYGRIFFTWRHALTWLTLIGIAISRRWPLVGIPLSFPYLWRNADRRYTSPRGLAVQMTRLPARFAVDSAEALVVLGAALRKRVVVL